MTPTTFSALIDRLSTLGMVTTARWDMVAMVVGGHGIEIARIRAGDDEWAALSTYAGPSAPPRHTGMTAQVRCPDGWALRLTLPIGQLDIATFRRAIARLVSEAAEIAAAQVPTETSSLFTNWV
jgi:hypothetical protein